MATLTETVLYLLKKQGIPLAAPIPLEHCTLLRPYLLERAGIQSGTVFVFAVPYYTTSCDDSARNISAYAVSADYHLFFKHLFDEILPSLREIFPQYRFAGFTDHSPIYEAEAAVKAGLGCFGKNHLFLTKDYSSFVFLGGIFTDAAVSVSLPSPTECLNCGACLLACPVGLDIKRCISALNQKKGTFTKEEEETILSHGSAWGCDICQEVCPITKKAKETGSIYTKIPFFKDTALSHLTAEKLDAMTDEEFSARAYSWRGKAVIERNLKLLERKE